MKEIVKVLQDATNLPVKPFGIDSLDECVIYSAAPQTDDGAKRTFRLELRLITKTVARAEEVRPLILNALVNCGDQIKIPGVLDCRLNGGGQLKDTNGTIHTIMYLYITMKSEVTYNG